MMDEDNGSLGDLGGRGAENIHQINHVHAGIAHPYSVNELF